jgi:hypothetical protein
VHFAITIPIMSCRLGDAMQDNITYSLIDVIKGLRNDGFLDYQVFQILHDPGFNISLLDISRAFVEGLNYDPAMIVNCIYTITRKWEDVICVVHELFEMDSGEIYSLLVGSWRAHPDEVTYALYKLRIP